MKKHTHESGYTLVEAIVAIGILTAGLLGAIVLAVQSIQVADIAESKLQAEYLAMEGVELTRALRADDAGYFDIRWQDVQDDIEAAGEANINIDPEGNACFLSDPACNSEGRLFFRLPDEDLIILTDTGSETKFARTVRLRHETDDAGNIYTRVDVEVAARVRGLPTGETNYSLTTQLYDI